MRNVEDEEKLTTEEETEASDSKKLPFALRNFYTFHNPIMEKMANSDDAEFLLLLSRNQVKESYTLNKVWFHNNHEENIGWRDAIENK
jgi:hypothetical protein